MLYQVYEYIITVLCRQQYLYMNTKDDFFDGFLDLRAHEEEEGNGSEGAGHEEGTRAGCARGVGVGMSALGSASASTSSEAGSKERRSAAALAASRRAAIAQQSSLPALLLAPPPVLSSSSSSTSKQ